jgi:serine/threonine-protein phosphatase PPG1
LVSLYSFRGVGCRFNGDAVKTFLQNNNLVHIVRTHQLCMEGYQLLFDNTLSTIWSAPNYCYRCGNLGSILEIDDNKNMFYNTYDAAPNQKKMTSVVNRKTNHSDYFL